jgi:hypothetical protein
MRHASSSQTYTWEIDATPFLEEWYQQGEREEYQDAMDFVSSLTSFIDFRQDQVPLRLYEISHEREYHPDSINLRFNSNKGLSQEEITRARELFLEDLEESIVAPLIAPHRRTPLMKQGITYEAEPGDDEPITLYTDPEWDGPIMELAVESPLGIEGPEDLDNGL